MKNSTCKLTFISAGILMLSLASYAAELFPAADAHTVTNLVVINPADAPELASLRAKEATLVAEQHALELKIFKVFRSLYVAREDVLKGDQELVKLAQEIARKQAELEKRTAEKYPEIGKQGQERDALTKEHSALGEQLREVRKRISVIRGMLPAEEKAAAPVKKD